MFGMNMICLKQIIILHAVFLVESSVHADVMQAQYFVKNVKSDVMYKSASLEKVESNDLFSCMTSCSDRDCLVVLYNHVHGHCFISSKPVRESDGTPRLGMTRWDVTMPTGRKPPQDIAPEHMGGKVLVTPRIDGKSTFLQIDVHNNTPSSFPDPKINQIFTMVYDPVADRLLIGLKVKVKILSCNLTDATSFVLVSRVSATSLSIDAKQRLIFFTSTWPGTVKRVDLNTKYKKEIIFVHGKKFYCTAVYPKERMLIFSSADAIFTNDYNGRKMKKLVVRAVTKCLSVDPYGGYLFYSNKQKLMKIKITEPEKQEKIWQLKLGYYDRDAEGFSEFDTYIHDIVFDGNYIYISHWFPISVTQINLADKKSKEIVFKQFDLQRLLLCIVP